MKSRSPVWICWCLSRLDELLKPLPHWEQLNGLSPVWTRWCLSRLDELLKPLPHTEQVKRLSPVWTRRCINKLDDLVNRLLHSEQAKGFSPVWTRRWLRSIGSSYYLSSSNILRKEFRAVTTGGTEQKFKTNAARPAELFQQLLVLFHLPLLSSLAQLVKIPFTPQASMLGPLLFVMYINDLDVNVELTI
eukprot:g42928.t1